VRVCLVTYEYPPRAGGEGTYTRSLAVELSRQGHEVTVVAPATGPVRGDEGVRLMTVEEGRWPLREARFLAGAELAIDRLVDDTKVDLIHVTFDFPTFLLHVRHKGVPCVSTVHHLQVAEAISRLPYTSLWSRIPLLLRGSVLSGLEGRILEQCDRVIAVSEFTAATLRQYLSVDPRSVTVVRNGVDPARFEGGDGDEFRGAFPRVGEKCVLYLGRIHPSKGLEVLIDAFSEVHRVNPDASLAIVGTGDASYMQQLASRTASRGIANSVIFTGKISDDLLPHAYAASTLTALPSFIEGFGLSVLESFASGRPCVATRMGALPELVTDGANGLLVEAGDSRGLGAAMERLLSDPRLASSLGENGRDLVERELNVETMAKKTSEVYENLVRAEA